MTDEQKSSTRLLAEMAAMRLRLSELESLETERTRVQQALRDSEERYRVLYEENPSMYFTVDPEGIVQSVNPFGARQLGYTVGELVNQPVLQVFHPEDRDAVVEQLASCVRSPRKVFDWEFRKVRKDGTVMWVRELARAVRDPQGRTVVLIVCEDITSRRLMEEELRESRERYRGLYTRTPVMLQSIDLDGCIVEVSDHWLDLLGYERNEVIGRKMTAFLTEPSRRFAEETVLPRFMRVGKTRNAPYEFVKKNGEIVNIELSAIAERKPDGEFLRSLAVLIDVTERRRAEEALKLAHAEMEQRVKERTEELRTSEAALRRSQTELQALAGRLLTAQEDERRRLAREMHDDLTQRLAALAMRFGRISGMLRDSSPEVKEQMAELQRTLANLSTESQAFSRRLHPSILEDLGLVDALEADGASFSKRTGIAVAFRARGVPAEIPKETALSLYRITQEALRNVEKHAATHDAHVSVLGVDGTLILSVEDAGSGFDLSAIRGKGLGLASMGERARLIGAELTVDSRPGKGTVIEVRVPLKPKTGRPSEPA